MTFTLKDYQYIITGKPYFRIPVCLYLVYLLFQVISLIIPDTLLYTYFHISLTLLISFSLIESLRKEGKFFSWGINISKNTISDAVLSIFSVVICVLLIIAMGILWGGTFRQAYIFNYNELTDYLIYCMQIAFVEEMLFRGLIFQSLIEITGTVTAAILSAFFFMIAHILNPAISIIALVNIFLVGLLFSAMYLRTKSLWLPIFFHGLWNFSLTVFLDSPVSGNISENNIFELDIVYSENSELFFGGYFGVEGGLAATIALIVAALITLYFAKSSPKIEAIIFNRKFAESEFFLDIKNRNLGIKNGNRFLR